MPKKKSTDFTESTRPGTVSKVFEQHKKTQLNYDGKLPVYIVPVIPINPNFAKYGNFSN
jgi:hypothetical protein